MISESDSQHLSHLLRELGKNAHGVDGLDSVTAILSGLKSTEKRIAVLKEVLVREPVYWEDVWKNVWTTQEEAESNRFPFLQGDLVKTRRVLELGQARSISEQDTWLILPSTCDISQGKGSLIRVAPAYPVYKSFKKSSTTSEQERYRILNISSQMKLKKCFPVPSLDLDNEMLAYICMLDEIAAIHASDINYTTPITSLTEEGWHLMGTMLKRLETQANIDEEIRIRTNVRKVVPIRKSIK